MTTKTNLAQPEYNSGRWDGPLNSNAAILNSALGSTTSVSLSSSNYQLTPTEAQAMRIAASGTLSANVLILIPAGVTGFWIVTNGTNGSYTLGVYSNNGSGSAAGAGVGIGQGYSSIVYSDGTNVYLADSGFATLSTPAGIIVPFGGTSSPTGWLMCDGSAVSRSTYSTLYSAIGTSWGAGDGVTTFNVPDLRGAFLRGSGAGLNPATRAVGSYQADAFTSHNHTITDPGHTHTTSSGGSGNYGGVAGGAFTFSNSGSALTANTFFSVNSAQTGITQTNSTGATETVPKNFAALYIIKT